MKLYINNWCYEKKCEEVLADYCFPAKKEPYEVPDFKGVLQLVDQLFNAGVQIMLTRHKDDPGAVVLFVDTHWFRQR